MVAPMKVLWVMLHPGSVRNFESTLRHLAERGHHVRVEFGGRAKLNEGPMLDRITRDWPAIVFDYAPPRAERDWALFASTLRCHVDYLRYVHPRYDRAPRLRARAGKSVGRLFRTCVRLPGVRRLAGLDGLSRALIGLERVIPRVAQIEALLERERPDVVLVSPLVDMGSDQVDHVKSARAHGIPVGLCVTSWDNLTNKGRIRPIPDLVAVWNEAQKREAVDLHGVPAERVAVTGAAAYDHWFDWKPRTGPDDFRARVGLPVGRPFVLYLGSSPFIAPDEASFVRRWLCAVRSAPDPALRSVGVLVRPHPQNAGQWRDVEFEPADDVAVWPRAGANPVDEPSRADYFDSMYHCAAVVGVNTSGLIESAILGRPVLTVVGPFAETQEGTLHFQHLLTVNGGLLHVARDLDEHGRQLAAVLAADGCPEDEKSRAFVAAFVRPHGRHVAATPLLVEAIETLGGGPRPMPVDSTLWARALRAALGPAVRIGGRAWRWRRRRLKRDRRA
jgi:hypothetical protein